MSKDFKSLNKFFDILELIEVVKEVEELLRV
jgi:hypothetical protein